MSFSEMKAHSASGNNRYHKMATWCERIVSTLTFMPLSVINLRRIANYAESGAPAIIRCSPNVSDIPRFICDFALSRQYTY